ncbi:T9SS type A sorting domain-containing protein [Hymenobacter algoricola]|uniref:RCC1 domain-containing protein n=1 Tax=Hymenobacter algoricola TaxID=486267 RepID=UPI0031EF1CD6
MRPSFSIPSQLWYLFSLALLLWSSGPSKGQSLPSPLDQVSAGAYHAAALDTTGSIWLWGRNNAGQVGDGSIIDRFRPTRLPAPSGVAGTRWSAVVAGTFHSAAIGSDGSLWTWGDNTNGQLGDGTTTPHLRPVQVPPPATAAPGTRWAYVALGANHTLALRSDGTLWAWGANYWGQLGDNSGVMQSRPVQIPAPTGAQGAYWTRVVTSEDHTLGLTSDGSLWGWGRDQRAQLGLGTLTYVRSFPTLAFRAPRSPTQSWVELATGEAFSLALRSDGILFACGANDSGQLGGSVTPTGFASLPVVVPPPVGAAAGSSWTHISARGAHAVAQRSDKSVWSWGENYDGELGINSTNNPIAPTQEFTGRQWDLAAAGNTFTLAVTVVSLFATGNNDFGQFGDGTTNGSLVFRSTAGPLAIRAVKPHNNIRLWPNPAADILHIGGISATARVRVFDMAGRLVMAPSRGTVDLSVIGLAKGVYIVETQEMNAPSLSSRLLIE